jgi:hypothetical protein
MDSKEEFDGQDEYAPIRDATTRLRDTRSVNWVKFTLGCLAGYSLAWLLAISFCSYQWAWFCHRLGR